MPKQEKKNSPKTTFKTLFPQWNTNECKQQKKHKEYQSNTCNKKIALQQQCSVLLNYWLTLKFNWTKLQHTLHQLVTISFRKNFTNLMYWSMSSPGHEIQSFFTSYLVLHLPEVWKCGIVWQSKDIVALSPQSWTACHSLPCSTLLRGVEVWNSLT